LNRNPENTTRSSDDFLKNIKRTVDFYRKNKDIEQIKIFHHHDDLKAVVRPASNF